MPSVRIPAISALLLLASACTHKSALNPGDWPYYGRDAGGTRYSPLTQINKTNVSRLQIAWTYHTGDVSDGSVHRRKSEFEATPILAGGNLYLSTPFNRVIALNPETGSSKWIFDPHIDLDTGYSEGLMNRGVTSWLDPKRKPGETCAHRIYIATIDARLISLDAATGSRCVDFGSAGQVDLKAEIRNIIRKGEYEETSPPAIIGDLIIVGSSIADNDRVDSPDGRVRAFDARTGALRWTWDPLPSNLAPTGGANAWSMISVDEDRDLVFVPTGAPSPDYHGFKRPGDNRWANSVVALRGSTGKFVWGFQLVHHDLWDYDTAAQPVLATIRHDGADVPVVIQGNKTGNLFVLNRDTGKPVFPVEERPVPQSAAEGESTFPTQPFPQRPPPLVPQQFAVMPGCHDAAANLQTTGIFTPPSVQGIVAFPGNLGGMNWSGGAFDPQHQFFVTNVNNLAMEVHLIPRDKFEPLEKSAEAGQFRGDVSPQHGTPYGMSRTAFRDASGMLCTAPPWGSLVAVDLSNGSIKWNVPLGTMADTHPEFPPGNGSPSLGGPIITAGGLIFIGGAMDNYLRAFDIETGAELWKGRLPAGGQATPMTYSLNDNGKQYVVIAAGGHGKLGTKLGDSLVAFALP